MSRIGGWLATFRWRGRERVAPGDGREAEAGTISPKSANRTGAFDYDAFATHATEPDGPLVREVEALLEGFHRRPDLAANPAVSLQLCVDGRDFIFPKRSRTTASDDAETEAIVRTYLRRSRSLLVFCGPESRSHPWVNKEVEWWEQDRADGPVYFALTHGADPADASANMPPALIKRGGGDTSVFFDLRGYYQRRNWLAFFDSETPLQERLREEARRWKSVRGFKEEIAKIVAYLVSDATGHAIAVTDLVAAYAEMERKARIRRTLSRCIISALLVLALGVAANATYSYVKESRRATVQSWIDQADVLSNEMGPNLVDALAFAANAIFDGDESSAVDALFRVNQKLIPIERSLRPEGVARSSEQTQVAVLFDSDRYLAFGGRESVLHVVDVAKGTTIASHPLRAGRIRSIGFWIAGRQLVVGTDHGVHRLELRTSGQTPTLEPVATGLERERIGGIAVDQDAGTLFAGTLNGAIFYFPLAGATNSWVGQHLTTIMDPNYAAKGIHDVPSSVFAMALRGTRLFVAGIDGIMTIFERANERLTIAWQYTHPSSIFAMDVTADGGLIAVADQQGAISIYEAGSSNRRLASVRAPNPASIARMPDAKWRGNSPDEPAAVGIAFDPSGSVVAVTGHDRTVKFLLVDDLRTIGVVVHAAAARGVVFSRQGSKAFTFGDDGVINLVSPLERNGDIRLGSVEGFAVASNGARFAYWTKRSRNTSEVFSLDPAAFPRIDRLGTTQLDAWSGVSFGPDHVALRQTGSTAVPVFAFGGAPSPCPNGALSHPNVSGAAQIVARVMPGTQGGEIATVSQPPGANAHSILRLWKAPACEAARQFEFDGRPSQAAAARDVVALVDHGKQVRLITPARAGRRQIIFDSEVESIAVGPSGDRLLAISVKSNVLCLCETRVHPRSPPSACHARSTSHACRALEIGKSDRGAFPSRIAMSPSGEVALALYGDAAIAIARSSDGWRFSRLAPAQLRPLEEPPFAFAANGALLAVPLGDRGIRIVEPSTLRTRALLPTPGRVANLGFLEDGSDRLLSLDSGVLRLWNWQRAAILRAACDRWPANVATDVPSGIAPVKSRSQICRGAIAAD